MELAAFLAQLKRLHPVKIDLALDRVEALLKKLGRPQDRLPPVVHVAGTNGKGSTVAFLKAMMEADGLRVHTFTSPHLISFTERISLAGTGIGGRSAPIAEDELVAFLRRAADANGNAPITFFEIVTAAAFLAFAEVPADALVLEVGLGGRLDATNVIAQPAASIITPVSLDHQEMLGGTLRDIAAEKAGILKAGVPAIVGPQPPEVLEVVEQAAAATGAELILFGRDFDAYEQNGRLVFQSETRLLDLPLPGLVGRHQITNAGVAVAAALAISTPRVGDTAIARGVAAADWPARFTRLDRGSLVSSAGEHTEVWIDGGHNTAAGVALAHCLAELDERSPKPVFLIVGMMQRKDAENFLAAFRGVVHGIAAVPVAGHESDAFDPDDLCDIAEAAGIDAIAEEDVRAALSAIEAWDVGPKRVLICGSLYLAGHVLAENLE